MIFQQKTIGILLTLIVSLSSFSAYSSPAHSLAKVARTLANDIAERAIQTKKELSRKHDVRQLEALSVKELDFLKGIHENPSGFFSNRYYFEYTRPVFRKAFLMELNNHPNVMEEIASDWYRRLLSLVGNYSLFVKGQIAWLVGNGVSREKIGRSILSVSFKNQMADFRGAADQFFQHLDETLDVDTIKKLLADGSFMNQGTISHADHGKNLVRFMEEVILPSQDRKTNFFWWRFNKIISYDNSVEIFDQLLLKVWRSLQDLEGPLSYYRYQYHIMLPFENILHNRMREAVETSINAFKSGGKNVEDLETSLYHDSNFAIIASAADQDESFSRYVHSIMEKMEWP